MKINNLNDLKAEKLQLEEAAGKITAAISADLGKMKRSIQPNVLIYRAISALIPDTLKNSRITGVPIDYILKALFSHKTVAEKPDPALEKRNQVKNMAINLLESTAMLLLTKKLKK